MTFLAVKCKAEIREVPADFLVLPPTLGHLVCTHPLQPIEWTSQMPTLANNYGPTLVTRSLLAFSHWDHEVV